MQKLDFPSMSVLQEFSLDSVYFAEGITILNDKIYQLTWKEKKMFIYSTDLVLQEIAYITEPIKEGWGMCNDGTSLYISDGTSYIYKIDPSTYEIINSIRVHQDDLYIKSINELEWVDGEIWANIYYSKYIARIDPGNGDVLGWIDLAGLETGEKMHWYSGYVLNGIAVYEDRIYVTGKCWENLYEIELVYDKSVSEAPKLKD